VLQNLVTDAHYQRQGVASALLDTVLAHLSSTGLPCILQATKLGEPVYMHRGWSVVDRIGLQDEEGTVLYSVPVMLRETDTPIQA
jgi:GNAT superfamily N-acetyltransferase